MNINTIQSGQIDNLQDRLSSRFDKKILDKYESTTTQAKKEGIDTTQADTIINSMLLLSDEDLLSVKNDKIKGLNTILIDINQQILDVSIAQIQSWLQQVVMSSNSLDSTAPEVTQSSTHQKQNNTPQSVGINSWGFSSKKNESWYIMPQKNSSSSQVTNPATSSSQSEITNSQVTIHSSPQSARLLGYQTIEEGLSKLNTMLQSPAFKNDTSVQFVAFQWGIQKIINEISGSDFWDNITDKAYELKLNQAVLLVLGAYKTKIDTTTWRHIDLNLSNQLEQYYQDIQTIKSITRSWLDGISDGVADKLDFITSKNIDWFKVGFESASPKLAQQIKNINNLKDKPLDDIFSEALFIKIPDNISLSSNALNGIITDLKKSETSEQQKLGEFLENNKQQVLTEFNNLSTAIEGLKGKIQVMLDASKQNPSQYNSPELRTELITYTGLIYLLKWFMENPDMMHGVNFSNFIESFKYLGWLSWGSKLIQEWLSLIFSSPILEYVAAAIWVGIWAANLRRFNNQNKLKKNLKTTTIELDLDNNKVQKTVLDPNVDGLNIEKKNRIKYINTFIEFAYSVWDEKLANDLMATYAKVESSSWAFHRELLITLFKTNGKANFLRAAFVRYFDLHGGRVLAERKDGYAIKEGVWFKNVTINANNWWNTWHPVLDPLNGEYDDAKHQVEEIGKAIESLKDGVNSLNDIDRHPQVFGKNEKKLQKIRQNLVNDLMNPHNIIARSILDEINKIKPLREDKKNKLHPKILMALDQALIKWISVQAILKDNKVIKFWEKNIPFNKISSAVAKGIKNWESEIQKIHNIIDNTDVNIDKKMKTYLYTRFQNILSDQWINITLDETIQKYIEERKFDVDIKEQKALLSEMVNIAWWLDKWALRVDLIEDFFEEVKWGGWTGTSGEFYLRLNNLLALSWAEVQNYNKILPQLEGKVGSDFIRILKGAKREFTDTIKNIKDTPKATNQQKDTWKKSPHNKENVDIDTHETFFNDKIDALKNVGNIDELTSFINDVSQYMTDNNLDQKKYSFQLNKIQTKVTELSDKFVWSAEARQQANDAKPQSKPNKPQLWFQIPAEDVIILGDENIVVDTPNVNNKQAKATPTLNEAKEINHGKERTKIRGILDNVAIELALHFDWDKLEAQLVMLDKQYNASNQRSQVIKISQEALQLRTYYKDLFWLPQLRSTSVLKKLFDTLDYTALPEWVHKFSDLKTIIRNSADVSVRTAVINALKNPSITPRAN